MQTLSLAGKWQFRQVGTDRWRPAQVPGGVHTDLMAAKLIPDPFVADNEKKVMWVAEQDWEYRRTLKPGAALLKEERIWLVCDGLDTLAEVHLNGQLLGKADNMFRQYQWEIKALLRPGENEVSIVFHSPVQYAAEGLKRRPLHGVSQAIPGGPYLRKAPCQFGWDWGPMLPPIGVWQDLRLEGRSAARLADVHLRQHAPRSGAPHSGDTDGQATLEASVQVEQWSDAPLTAEVYLTAPDGLTLVEQTEIVDGSDKLTVEVERPQLWWPNGYGEQALYKVEVAVLQGDTVCDRRDYQIGFRTVELRQQPDEWGTSFTFVVNGVPVFAKGSDWIPADSFPTRLTDEFLEHLIRSAAETHQNMLRVWGGGFYEEERFYDLCDRYGILVWQDMVFSCSIYPLGEQAFLDNLAVEVEQNVKRLRHRASLALWCGNNEMEQGWEEWGWNKPELADLKADYEKFFYHTLPAWIAQYDTDHAYWPSSPSSNTPLKDTQSQAVGDAHYWQVWHGRQPFTAYRGQYPRFMSEFGFQSLPPMETVKTYAEPQDWNMTSYIMEHHQRSAKGNGLMIAQMTDTFRMPSDFPALVYLSMVLQAEGIRYGVEHWRRNRQRVSGTLYWQLNDCWPVASWASLDYFGRWKALHYAAKKFYAPVLLSLLDEGNKIGLNVTSDLLEAWQGEVRWSLVTLQGKTLQKGKQAVSVEPLQSVEVGVIEAQVPEGREREVVFVAELYHKGKRSMTQLATFVPNKHLELIEPELTAEVERQGDQLAITISAAALARFVELELEGADVVFSDNYFDVPAKQSVTVTCPLPAGWTLAKARKALRGRSLYNSFA